MITNLLCSVVVSLVTNVVETDNSKGCSVWQGIADNHWALFHPWHEGCGPYVAPTWRTNTVRVVRVTEVRFEMGGSWLCRREDVVSEVATVEHKAEQWVK